MNATLETRKPVDRLDLNDFSAFAVWRYALDEEGLEGRDETWVRPVDTPTVPRRDWTLVAADFVAASGRKFSGFVNVSTHEDTPEIFRGVIIHESRHLLIPDPILGEWTHWDLMTTLLTGLELTETELFPITCTLRVPIGNHLECLGTVLDLPRRQAVREHQQCWW